MLPLLHMPTKIMIYSTDPKSQAFPHAEYWGMTYFGGIRMAGMKNPGYKGNTFVGRVYPTCISYSYEAANPMEEVVADPVDNAALGTEPGPVVPPSSDSDEAAPTPVSAATTVVGGRTTRKHKKGRRVSRRKHRKSHARRH